MIGNVVSGLITGAAAAGGSQYASKWFKKPISEVTRTVTIGDTLLMVQCTYHPRTGKVWTIHIVTAGRADQVGEYTSQPLVQAAAMQWEQHLRRGGTVQQWLDYLNA